MSKLTIQIDMASNAIMELEGLKAQMSYQPG
jgi:hypothetical protein